MYFLLLVSVAMFVRRRSSCPETQHAAAVTGTATLGAEKIAEMKTSWAVGGERTIQRGCSCFERGVKGVCTAAQSTATLELHRHSNVIGNVSFRSSGSGPDGTSIIISPQPTETPLLS
jgi:hypothetical protein